MTNKPMLSVERELLELFVSDVEAHNYGFEGLEAMRALLDNPVLESQYEGMTQDQAQAVSDGVDEILHGKGVQLYPRCTILKECNVKSSPSSYARVGAVSKPITRRICHGCVGLKREVFCCICDEDQPADQPQGEFEQPAPVAVLMPEHTMRSVMDAIQQARGLPMLTSNQCHALAESLNYVASLNGATK